MRRDRESQNIGTQRSIAEERSSARRSGWLRLARTVVFGSVALTAAVFWGAEQFGVPRETVLEFFTGSVIFVGGLILAGLVGALLLFGLRKLVRGWHPDE